MSEAMMNLPSPGGLGQRARTPQAKRQRPPLLCHDDCRPAWTPERVKHLTALWGAGFSAGTIARALDATIWEVCDAAALHEIDHFKPKQRAHSTNVKLARWLLGPVSG